MKQEEIHWGDWHRILFGMVPAEFLIEVLVRTVIVYILLLITLRFLGKRMGGQLTISELAVMLTLGAIISVPMQIPERGLLQGLLVLVCAVVFQRGLNYFAVKYNKIERFTQGKESLLVQDGVIAATQLARMKISREQLAAELRCQNIYNLGEVRRVYLEASGLFSIFKYPKPRPGLSLLPIGEETAEKQFSDIAGSMVCFDCGNRASTHDEAQNNCKNCGSKHWTNAVISKLS
ncbi:DUF421 domain-containing protein [Pedobacter endophyticus]|uniref:DUF421 domain-containing protein n=1 Tax=Pedobacter endophyticus TaxID=2789740 RepID=A0A7S9L0D0_9SPHI|nr:YetF domain-containing protein [Pedobacter endophyticus]QPH40179.1 DUF421 domain-containing protein [Pedobacter endophyticus]